MQNAYSQSLGEHKNTNNNNTNTNNNMRNLKQSKTSFDMLYWMKSRP